MDTTGHILSDFETALKSLRESTIEIGVQTQNNMSSAVNGLLQRDVESCNRVIADDEEVDQLEIQIDNDVINIMAKYRPFASDLRMVVSSMKITHNLERISDHAVSIAKRARKILRSPEIPEISLIEPVYNHASNMLQTALVAYTDSDLEKAKEVLEMEKELYTTHKKTSKQLVKKLEDPSDNHKLYIHLVFINRWLERLGDLSVNIAEDVVYMLAAQDIRHGGELEE